MGELDLGVAQWGESLGPKVLPEILKAIQWQLQERRRSQVPGVPWFCETWCPRLAGSSWMGLATSTNRPRSRMVACGFEQIDGEHCDKVD